MTRASGAVVLAAAALMGCSGNKTACASLSDKDAVARIARDYAAEPASTKGDPAQTQFTPGRVLGIGRSPAGTDPAKAVTQVWFAQDDHTVTVVSLSASCEHLVRPGLDPDAIKQAALPVKPGRF
jgi:hypothetical protein